MKTCFQSVIIYRQSRIITAMTDFMVTKVSYLGHVMANFVSEKAPSTD